MCMIYITCIHLSPSWLCIFRSEDINVDPSIYYTTDDDTVRIVQANQPKTAIKSSNNDDYELETEDVESHEEEKVLQVVLYTPYNITIVGNFQGAQLLFFSRGPIFVGFFVVINICEV